LKAGVPYAQVGNYVMELSGIRKDFLSERRIVVSARPQEIRLESASGPGLSAVIDDCVFLGQSTHYFMHLEDGFEVETVQESTIDTSLERGTKVKLGIDAQRVNVFTEDGSTNILEGVRNDAK
jgi:iron(III) transport system ATP-binding protein